MKKIAVVILNWNGKSLLEQFLPTVLKYSAEAKIYVVDNASTDNSVLFLTQNFPNVKVIQNKENGGYAKGYNQSLQFVTEPYYVLLNSDVEVTENWLSPLVNILENNPQIAAVQPKIKAYHKKYYFEYAGAAGGFIDRLGYPYCRGRIFNTLEKDTGQYNDDCSIFWASGACLALRASAFWQIKGFDEDLFAHQEEIDLCWQLQKIGYKIYYTGSSTVYHLGGSTLSYNNPKKTFFNFRNSLLILLKNNSAKNVYLLLIVRIILDGVAALKFLLTGNILHFVAIFKAHLSFYNLFFKFYKKRKGNIKLYKYYMLQSILWKYFIQKKKYFNNIH